MKKIFLLFVLLIAGCSQHMGVSVSKEKDAGTDVSVSPVGPQPYNFNYCSAICLPHRSEDISQDQKVLNKQVNCLRTCLGVLYESVE